MWQVGREAALLWWCAHGIVAAAIASASVAVANASVTAVRALSLSGHAAAEYLWLLTFIAAAFWQSLPRGRHQLYSPPSFPTFFPFPALSFLSLPPSPSASASCRPPPMHLAAAVVNMLICCSSFLRRVPVPAAGRALYHSSLALLPGLHRRIVSVSVSVCVCGSVRVCEGESVWLCCLSCFLAYIAALSV